MQRLEQHASFGGRQEVWSHASGVLGCEMRFGIYLPEAAVRGEPRPVLYWLSGLTCTEQNFITKANAQAHAARHGLVVVAPDTSPRGPGVADDTAYHLGQGAGFYLNALQAPWAPHYRMQDYVAQELPALVEQHFPASQARGICGHSMGGHGALVTALRHPGRYRSVSAFSPIVAPSQVPWGQKAFAAYLGEDRGRWKEWDAVELVGQARERLPLLVDQGLADEFLVPQLRPRASERPIRSRCGSTRGTTTATTSSRPSSATTWRTTPRPCAAEGPANGLVAAPPPAGRPRSLTMLVAVLALPRVPP